MRYSLYILRRAQKQIARIPTKERDKIYEAIRKLSGNPHPKDSLKLSGREGWRLKIGRYRVIYEIDDEEKSIIILDVGHRKDVYR